MLNYKKDQLLSKYSNTTLKVNRTLLKEFGYVADETFLEISGYRIFCAPSTMGIQDCTLILTLNESEMSNFAPNFKHLNSLHFSYKAQDDSKKVNFFIRGIISNTEKNETHINVWTLTFQLKSESDYYLRFFLLMSDLTNKYYKLYKNSNPAVFGHALLLEVIHTNTVLVAREQIEITSGNISSISVNSMHLVLKPGSYQIDSGDYLSFIFKQNKELAGLKGIVEKIENSDNLEVKLDFHMGLVNHLFQYIDISDVEELDNTEI